MGKDQFAHYMLSQFIRWRCKNHFREVDLRIIYGKCQYGEIGNQIPKLFLFLLPAWSQDNSILEFFFLSCLAFSLLTILILFSLYKPSHFFCNKHNPHNAEFVICKISSICQHNSACVSNVTYIVYHPDNKLVREQTGKS